MDHPFISERYQKSASTPMGKLDVLAKTVDNCIDLGLGDPDLGTDPLIIEKAFEDAGKGHTKYTDFRGDPELRQEICNFYEEEYGITVSYDEVFVTASACLGMFLALEVILNDGDEVILQAPYFTPYPQQVKLARGVPVELPTFEEEDFQINMERLEHLINERTKALVINSPSNPTGNCLTVETMKALADLVTRHDLIVISDDIYTAFSYEHPFVPFISIPGMRERTIVLNSFSKNFTMTGWRVGNIVAPVDIVDVIQQVNENVVFTAPSISQRAALHALRNRSNVQPDMIAEYRDRVFYAAGRINEINNMHVIYPPKGSFYLFINIKKTGHTSEEVADYLLKNAQVLVVSGNAFGTCGEGFVRIACTVGIPVLEEVFDRIENLDWFKK